MQQEKSFRIKNRINSFVYAIHGVNHLLRKEPNMMIHLMATVVVVAAGFARHISGMEWIAICIVIALVWITEIFNTCIETICDLYCDHKFHSTVKIIKDISAAAVLIAALISVIVGVIVFVL